MLPTHSTSSEQQRENVLRVPQDTPSAFLVTSEKLRSVQCEQEALARLQSQQQHFAEGGDHSIPSYRRAWLSQVTTQYALPEIQTVPPVLVAHYFPLPSPTTDNLFEEGEEKGPETDPLQTKKIPAYKTHYRTNGGAPITVIVA